MANTSFRDITVNGLWKNNPGLVQLLGLCPLLGVTNSTVNALGLALATALVLTCSNIAVSLIRSAVTDAVRLPAFVMIIAALTTCTELLMQAFTYELYQILGIFIPLITTNCIILGRADAFAAKNPVSHAALDGFMMGVGFGAVLLAIGMLRELLGSGTLFANMQLLLGPMASGWTMQPFGASYQGFLLAILPPGAFLVLGLLIALKNIIDDRLEARAKAAAVDAPKVSRRVRVTGVIE
ncbi:electron transport complex protein RnfE [Atopomonas hussainii]|uniref:Ion-translocating oxidoreductase complex subunit E n=1 Tax=Atopomonas hussainii TaxID=1429083 RepID=A0A1H7IQL2_9GAMM|nr:electron transport complex subunit E [Atopomonas hussainii]SEK64739.1 electron transport complex protein RnfE [Atopomonas hussainii]